MIAAWAVALLAGLGGDDASDVPHLSSAAQQLEHALRLRRAVRAGERGGPVSRAAAESALRAVCERFPESRETCAEAAFRLGELLRADGESERALAAFGAAVERGAGGVFATRAAVEIGHLHRRAERFDRALDVYFAVFVDPSVRARDRDVALLWAGDVWLESGDGDQARRAWTRVASASERVLDRVRAWDRIALSYLAEGDPAAARDVLARCERALATVARELTQRGRAVRSALPRMRVRARLGRAESTRSSSGTRRSEGGSSRSALRLRDPRDR